METRLRIELFGGLRVLQGDHLITRFSTRKTSTLLAYLAFARTQPHPREHLMELLWPECEPDAGRNRLSTALSSLRHQLEPPGTQAGTVILADRASVCLNPEAVTTDTSDFTTALHTARRTGSDKQKVRYLTEAVGLYTGELLPGYFDEWILAGRQQLAGRYFEALRHLTAYLVKGRRIEQAIEYARLAVGVEPFHEEAHLVLMRLLHANGQPEAAMRQYRDLERLLDEQLGETPSSTARKLYQQLTSALPLPLPEVPRPAVSAETELALPLPTGTVTLMLTDLERTQEQNTALTGDYAKLLADYRIRCRRLVNALGGREQKETEGAFELIFTRATDALMCAIGLHLALAELTSPDSPESPRVRMALEMGEISSKEGDGYLTLHNRAARLLMAAHGGQILCSESATALLRRDPEAEQRLIDLGLFRFAGSLAPERIFSVVYPGMLHSAFPPLKATPAYTSYLPLQITRFFGREEEIQQLEQLLSRPHCLVTLTGPGGSGKTRLALEAASRQVESLQGAVWFVPLADLREASGILEVIRDTLHLPRFASVQPSEQIITLLAEQSALLVLDNFEHLLENGTDAVLKLWENLPNLRLLITSRQILNLAGEREFMVPPLPTPLQEATPEQLTQCESVQLYVDRAQAVRPDFQVTQANAQAIAELCTRLEGIPLALELAASRSQVMTPAQMLLQLEHRFDLLQSRRRDLAPRHRTLRAAIDWSYQNLTPELQRLFARLCVFRGGWTAEAAEAVCDSELGNTLGSTLDSLAMLRECSLILSEEIGGQIRFRMLETLREYAEEKRTETQEASSLARAHAHYFLRFAETYTTHLFRQDHDEWLNRLEIEHDNLRAALQWSLNTVEGPVSPRISPQLLAPESPAASPQSQSKSVSPMYPQSTGSPPAPLDPTTLNPTEVGMYLSADLMPFCWTRGFLQEGRSWAERFLTLERARTLTEARMHLLRATGILATMQGDYHAAYAFLSEGIGIARARKDDRNLVSLLANLGILLKDDRDYEQAEPVFAEALEIARSLEDRATMSSLLNTLAGIALYQGDHTQSRALLEQSLALDRELGNVQGFGVILNNLALLARLQEDYSGARAYLKECLELCHTLGDRRVGAHALEALAGVLIREGEYAEATQLLGAAQGLRESMGLPISANDQEDADQELALARTGLGDAFELTIAEGRRMDWDQAIPYALNQLL